MFIRSNPNAQTYKLCRRDTHSVKRHAKRCHDNNYCDVRPYNDTTKIVKQARDALEQFKLKSPSISKPRPIQIQSLSEPCTGLPESSKPVFQKQSIICLDSSNKIVTENNEKEKPSGIEILAEKLDSISLQLKDIKQSNCIQIPSTEMSSSSELHEIMLEWPNINNIIQLTNVCSFVTLKMPNKSSSAILQCQLCCDYLDSKTAPSS